MVSLHLVCLSHEGYSQVKEGPVPKRTAQPVRCAGAAASFYKTPVLGMHSCFQFECVEFEELLNNRLIRFFHVAVGAKKNRLGFMEKNHPVRKLLGQAHIVCHHYAGQMELFLQ